MFGLIYRTAMINNARAVLILSQLDERVVVALTEENAYWQTDETKMQAIRRRFQDANRLAKEKQ